MDARSVLMMFSYSQFTVFDRIIRSPGCRWTEGHSAHHLVSGNDARSRQAFDILTGYRIDINSVENGVFLPMSFHQRLHTNAYWEDVRRRFEGVDSRERALDALDQLRRDLLKRSEDCK